MELIIEIDEYNMKTATLKACFSCGGSMIDCDRFCRWCGIHQPVFDSVEPVASCHIGDSSVMSRAPYTTASLSETGIEWKPYRPVSGPLVRATVAGIAASSATQSYSGFGRKLIFALVSLPIWLMIVLLAPFDAYATARSIAEDR